MTPNPILDPTGGTGIFARMVRRIISSAMRSSIEELLRQPLNELNDGQKRLETGLAELRLDQQNLRGAFLSLTVHVNEMGGRLDKRIDDLTAQQNRLVEQVATLGGEVAALKRDQKSEDAIERRLTRIEDRLFAQAG